MTDSWRCPACEPHAETARVSEVTKDLFCLACGEVRAHWQARPAWRGSLQEALERAGRAEAARMRSAPRLDLEPCACGGHLAVYPSGLGFQAACLACGVSGWVALREQDAERAQRAQVLLGS